ncbi:MAG TPA: alpha/beta fold hydrolase [Micromonosporaceae bacterium]
MSSETEAAQEGRRAPAGDLRRRLLSTLPVTEQRLGLAGISTATLVGGEGPPVVLLHGPAGYAAHWIRVIPGLAATNRVVAPDLPGHGASEADTGDLNAARMLEWLGQLIERTCPTRPILVGHLLGGAIAARFAIEHPDRLARLVLVDTFGLARFEPSPEFGMALHDYLSRPAHDTHDQFWRHCSFQLDQLRDHLGDAWTPFRSYNLDRLRAPQVQTSMGSLMAQFAAEPIPADELAEITVATSLIWGRHDRATPLPIAEAASAAYGWPLHVIDDANDDPAIDQPQAFLRALHGSTDAAQEES